VSLLTPVLGALPGAPKTADGEKKEYEKTKKSSRVLERRPEAVFDGRVTADRRPDGVDLDRRRFPSPGLPAGPPRKDARASKEARAGHTPTGDDGPEMTVRVLLVEDHAIFRELFASTFDREPGFEVVAQAGTLAGARGSGGRGRGGAGPAAARRGGNGPHRRVAREEPARRGPHPDREPGHARLCPGGGGRRGGGVAQVGERRGGDGRDQAPGGGGGPHLAGGDRKAAAPRRPRAHAEPRGADRLRASSPLASGTCCAPWPRDWATRR
jgi:hypothetical protein